MIARRVGEVLEIWDESRLCGTYHDHDPYKSFFRGLYTPSGLNVVADPPPDHPHHKGLQFGLCATDVNFWEEDAQTEPGHRRIGKQETQSLSPSIFPADEGTGFVQEILWRDDVNVSFQETRRISVEKRSPAAYVWTWQTTLIALRDLEIVKSAWSTPIGYCGLGLRLAADLFRKGTLRPAAARSGDMPSSVAFEGTGAEVIFAQDTARQSDVLFVMGLEPQNEFAFLSLGPTNLHPLSLKQTERLDRTYVVTVANR